MILGVTREASKAEIKKAYHKAALSSHPDKVPESERADADVKFKSVSKAYEILFDDDKRHLYDTHGMSAFDPRAGGSSAEVNMEDILAQMMGMGGGMGPGPGGRRSQKPRKGKDEEQSYTVTLEDLYKGKTVKFASTKNVICTHCKGTGGKEKAKPRQCSSCEGQGMVHKLQPVGPGMVTRVAVICSNCSGTGSVYNPKDRCKKCNGEKVTKTKKALELYIPRGSKHGEKIRLEGEADQVPDQEPGDLVFMLDQTEHALFERSGADLRAPLNIKLGEALCGFSRVVIEHLDGRGIHVDHSQAKGSVLKPGQVLKIKGEGMPIKKSESKGNLYLIAEIEFPDHAWLKKNSAFKALEDNLPEPEKPVEAEIVDEVAYTEMSREDAFAEETNHDHEWEDDDDEDGMGSGEPQCQQQ